MEIGYIESPEYLQHGSRVVSEEQYQQLQDLEKYRKEVEDSKKVITIQTKYDLINLTVPFTKGGIKKIREIFLIKEEFETLRGIISEMNIELNTIKQKWWYKLFSNF